MRIKILSYFIIALVLISVLFSCKSAEQISEKHLVISLKHDTAHVVKRVRALAPCITGGTTSDSTDYKLWQDAYDSLYNQMIELQEKPPVFPDTIRIVEEKLCPNLNDDLNYYKVLAASRKDQIGQLNNSIKNLKPIHDTTKVKDSADVIVLNDQLKDTQKKLTSAARKADHYFIWAVASTIGFLLAIIAAILLFKFKKTPNGSS